MSNWLITHRVALFRLGVEQRDALMLQYMTLYGLTERPFLKRVFRELIGEYLGARIINAPLPMDRYAQTEVEHDRPLITINSLIGRMANVKDSHGVGHVAAWHEGLHVLADIERRDLPPLTELPRGLEDQTSSPLLCSAGPTRLTGWTLREQAIDMAALAASIADADLRRCQNYLNFLQYAAGGGELGALGWQLLTSIANVIGVNRTALCRYFEQHGLCRVDTWGGKTRLIGTAPPFRGFLCLEPASAT